MFIEKAKLIINMHRLLDLFITTISFIGSYFIKKYTIPDPYRYLSQDPNYYAILFMVIIFWYISFNVFDLYRSYRFQKLKGIAWDTVKAVFTGLLLLSLSLYFLRFPHISRMMIFIFFVLNITLLLTSKTIIFHTLKYFRNIAYNQKNIVIVGDKNKIQKCLEIFKDSFNHNYTIKECIAIDREEVGTKISDKYEISCSIDTLENLLRNQVVDEIVFAIQMTEIKNIEKYISIAEEIGVSVRFVPEWLISSIGLKPIIGSMHIEEFFGIPTLTLTTIPIRHGELFIKTASDYILSIITVVLTSPLLIIISIAIKITSRGKIIYKQERLGLNGRRFNVYKFRTMVEDADDRRKQIEEYNEADGPVFKMKSDPRIISYVGHFLRRTHLDELPQLINVLKGEMCLVGPRPPIPNEVEKYDMWQRRRLSMKPGITCIWQISDNKNNMSFNEWMDLDLKYIDDWSLLLDMKILLKTIWVVFLGTGR